VGHSGVRLASIHIYPMKAGRPACRIAPPAVLRVRWEPGQLVLFHSRDTCRYAAVAS
jgi:hypothetical protein